MVNMMEHSAANGYLRIWQGSCFDLPNDHSRHAQPLREANRLLHGKKPCP